MDLRKGAKSLQVFQIFKKEFNTAVPALGTHLSQKLRAHPHLHTEKVPFVLDHDNDFSSVEPFIHRGAPAPADTAQGGALYAITVLFLPWGEGKWFPGRVNIEKDPVFLFAESRGA